MKTNLRRIARLCAASFSMVAAIACGNTSVPPTDSEPMPVASAAAIAIPDAGPARAADDAAPPAAEAAAPKLSPLLRHPRRVVVEVAYAEGAEPYEGRLRTAQIDTWEITRANLARLFGDNVTLSVPTSVDAMDRVVGAPQGTATAQQLVDFAKAHRIKTPDDEVGFYVLFVDATFTDASGDRPDVLAANIGDTGVLGVFKPSITAAVAQHGNGVFTSGLDVDIGRFIEQSTLVHELGHAIGLVGRRLDVTSPHKDADHGAHCNSESCVMYWALETGPVLVDFAVKALSKGSVNLFGDECLADVDAVR